MGRRVKLKLYNKTEYHPKFFERRKRCVAKGVCLHCGKKRGDEYVSGAGRISKVVIQAAHRDHDPWNAKAVLIPLCKACHLAHDRDDHAKKASRTYHRKVREGQIVEGQLVGKWYEKKPGRKRA